MLYFGICGTMNNNVNFYKDIIMNKKCTTFMDPEVRNKEQAEYEDQLAAMIDEQEAQQLEQDVM